MSTEGQQLRALRVAAGVTQAEIASALDVSEASISHWEKGVRPISISALRDYAARCGATVEIMVHRAGEVPTPVHQALITETRQALPDLTVEDVEDLLSLIRLKVARRRK